MQNEAWIELINRVPLERQDGLGVQLHSGIIINIMAIYRLEPEIMVVKGRLSGMSDTGFVFFVPYDEIENIYYQKHILEHEVHRWFGEDRAAPRELSDTPEPAAAPVSEPAAIPAPAAAATAPKPAAAPPRPTTVPMTTPRSGSVPLPGKAAILERLRKKTSTSATGTTPKPPPIGPNETPPE
jgi:hypothetical protein